MTGVAQDACPDCGVVRFNIADLTIRICLDTDQASYHFRCPKCQMVVSRNIHERMRELLTNYGVPVVPWMLPEELREVHDGPPISVDDVIDFHQALNGMRR